MGKRNIEFTKNEYYHIYNRGVDKRIIFNDKKDLFYFFDRLNDLNADVNISKHRTRDIKLNKKKIDESNKLISIVSYCLLPNHFHLILKQELENGISIFMQKLGTAHTMYYNKKYKRSGSLFQGKFKAKLIKGNLSLPTVSAYVSLNYKHHGLDIKQDLVKSSVFEYLKKEQGRNICFFDEIIEEIGSVEKYKKFMENTSKTFIHKKGFDEGYFDFDELNN